MQNTIEKGMKIHPVATLVAVLACMLVFYVCNFIMMRLSKNRKATVIKEAKRVEDVKAMGRGVIESEIAEPERVEDLKVTEKDIERMRMEKARAKTTIDAKPLPVLIKT